MSSTYSTSLKLELIGNGDQSGTWGTTTNNNLGTLLEQAITGVQAITMSNADYTLSNYNGTSDEARNAVLFVSGTNSDIRKIVAPQGQNKLYTIFNNTTGGYAITIGAPTGTAVTIPSGVTATVFTNGSDFYSAQTGSAGNFTVNGTLTATGLTDTGNMSVGGTFTATSGTVTIGSGAITGVVTAPTAASGTSTTQIATTAFALANGIPSGAIVMWSGSIATIPSGWYLCNGGNGTPDLRDQFVVGAGNAYAVGDTGGSANATLPTHTHTASVTDPGHTHGYYVGTTVGGRNGGAAPVAESPITMPTVTTGISVNIGTTGSSATNANLPPYYALAYIMKA